MKINYIVCDSCKKQLDSFEISRIIFDPSLILRSENETKITKDYCKECYLKILGGLKD